WRSQGRGRDLPSRIDEPALALERLAIEPRDHPIRHEREWERPEIGRRHIADGMAAVRINHQLSRTGHRPYHALGMFERTELVRFASQHQVGRANLLDVPFPCERPGELIELRLVGVVGHPHETFLEGGRSLFKNRMTARLEAS